MPSRFFLRKQRMHADHALEMEPLFGEGKNDLDGGNQHENGFTQIHCRISHSEVGCDGMGCGTLHTQHWYVKLSYFIRVKQPLVFNLIMKNFSTYQFYLNSKCIIHSSSVKGINLGRGGRFFYDYTRRFCYPMLG